MTKNKDFKYEDISFLIQYAPLDITDDGVLNAFNYKLKSVINDERDEFKNLIIEIDKNMTNIDNDYNQVIFNQLYYHDFDLETLQNVNEFTKSLANENYEMLNTLTDYHLSDIANEDIYDIDTLHEIIDRDIKENGLDGQFINLVGSYQNLERNIEYVKVNAYLNGFDNEYTDYNLALKDTFENNYKEVFDEFFEKHFNTFSKGRQL